MTQFGGLLVVSLATFATGILTRPSAGFPPWDKKKVAPASVAPQNEKERMEAMRKRNGLNRAEVWSPVTRNLPAEDQDEINKQLETDLPSWRRLFGWYKPFGVLRSHVMNPQDIDPVKKDMEDYEGEMPTGDLESPRKFNAVGGVEDAAPFQALADSVLAETDDVKKLKDAWKESYVLRAAQHAIARGPPARKVYFFPLFEYAPKEGHAGMFVEFGLGLQLYPNPTQWWDIPRNDGRGGGGQGLLGWDLMEITVPLKALWSIVETVLIPLQQLGKLVNEGYRNRQWPLLPNALEYGDWRITDQLGRLLHIKLGYKFANGMRVFSKNMFGDTLGKEQWWKYVEVGGEFVHVKEDTENPAADKHGWNFRIKHGWSPIFHGTPRQAPVGDPQETFGPMTWFVEAGYAGTYVKPVWPMGKDKYLAGGGYQGGQAWRNFDKTRYVSYEGDSHSSSVTVGYFEETDFFFPEWKMPQILSDRQKTRVLADYYKLGLMKKIAEETQYYKEMCLEDEKTKNLWWRKYGDCERWNLYNFKTGDIVFFNSNSFNSFVIRAWTNSDVHHSTLIIWMKYEGGEWTFQKEGCAECLITCLEMTSTYTRDLVTGVVDNGFLIRSLLEKMAANPIETRFFVKHRKQLLTDKELSELDTLASCLYTRRPLYLYSPKTRGKDAITRKTLMMNEKITNPQDETFERMMCSQATGLFISVWFEAPLIFTFPEGKPGEGQAVQKFVKEKQNDKGETVQYEGLPMLPGDFAPHDVAFFEHEDYGKVIQYERPWIGFKRFRDEVVAQELLIKTHPELKTWKQLAQHCVAGLDDLKFVKDFLPYWYFRMKYVAESVIEGNVRNIRRLPSEDTVTGMMAKEDLAKKIQIADASGVRMPLEDLSAPENDEDLLTPENSEEQIRVVSYLNAPDKADTRPVPKIGVPMMNDVPEYSEAA